MTQSNTMQAIRYHRYGDAEQLALERAPRPQVQPGSVLVQVKAAGVNPWDWKLHAGAFQQFMPVQFPYTPGIELAGVVEEIGSGVTGFQKGQAVYGSGGSTQAEYAVVAANGLAPMPGNLSFEQAAGVPVGALTAWRALFDLADLQPGQHVLIQGAAGGVGSFAVQLARWKGAHVIGTASARNLEFVRKLGAEVVIDYGATPFETRVHDVDFVFDTVGGDLQERSLRVLRPGGLYVTAAGQPLLDVAEKLGVRAEYVGQSDPALAGGVLRQLTALIEAGTIRVQVDTVFPLAEAGRAHARSQQGHGRGRIVLAVAGQPA